MKWKKIQSQRPSVVVGAFSFVGKFECAGASEPVGMYVVFDWSFSKIVSKNNK